MVDLVAVFCQIARWGWGAIMEIILIWIICAVVCAIIASAKGRTGFGWFLLGLVFGIFALVLVACLPSLKPVQVAYAAPSRYAAPIGSLHSGEKACPDCGETILKVAKVCKHCGFRLAPPSDLDAAKPARTDVSSHARFVAASPVPSRPGTVICVNCGRENGKDDVLCECGMSVRH